MEKARNAGRRLFSRPRGARADGARPQRTSETRSPQSAAGSESSESDFESAAAVISHLLAVRHRERSMSLPPRQRSFEDEGSRAAQAGARNSQSATLPKARFSLTDDAGAEAIRQSPEVRERLAEAEAKRSAAGKGLGVIRRMFKSGDAPSSAPKAPCGDRDATAPPGRAQGPKAAAGSGAVGPGASPKPRASPMRRRLSSRNATALQHLQAQVTLSQQRQPEGYHRGRPEPPALPPALRRMSSTDPENVALSSEVLDMGVAALSPNIALS